MFNILRKNSKIILTAVLFFAVILLFIISRQSFNNNEFNNNEPKEAKEISQACIKEKCFNVEIVDNPREREIGLMNREYLESDSGMFFVFEKEGVYKFWMKNTLIPLDIIWIDENHKIIYIEKNAEPCKVEQCGTFGPNKKAKYVLEINGGLAGEMGVGGEVEFK